MVHNFLRIELIRKKLKDQVDPYTHSSLLMDQHTTLSDQPNSGNNELNDMVTTLTSTVDGDEAPSTVDNGVALH